MSYEDFQLRGPIPMPPQFPGSGFQYRPQGSINSRVQYGGAQPPMPQPTQSVFGQSQGVGGAIGDALQALLVGGASRAMSGRPGSGTLGMLNAYNTLRTGRNATALKNAEMQQYGQMLRAAGTQGVPGAYYGTPEMLNHLLSAQQANNTGGYGIAAQTGGTYTGPTQFSPAAFGSITDRVLQNQQGGAEKQFEANREDYLRKRNAQSAGQVIGQITNQRINLPEDTEIPTDAFGSVVGQAARGYYEGQKQAAQMPLWNSQMAENTANIKKIQNDIETNTRLNAPASPEQAQAYFDTIPDGPQKGYIVSTWQQTGKLMPYKENDLEGTLRTVNQGSGAPKGGKAKPPSKVDSFTKKYNF